MDAQRVASSNAEGSATSDGSAGVASSSPNVARLQRIARDVRRDIVTMTAEAGSGHPGGSLSAVELLVALYFHAMRHRPDDPAWPDRDRFIESKGHACPVLYSVLARSGYFPVEELATFRKLNSRLQGHAKLGTPGVEMSSGLAGAGAVVRHRRGAWGAAGRP